MLKGGATLQVCEAAIMEILNADYDIKRLGKITAIYEDKSDKSFFITIVETPLEDGK